MRANFEKVQAFVDAIVERFHPRRVILFGSEARGEAGLHSDVDLLVVMPDGGDPLGKAIQITRAVPHHGFSLDLIVRDPDVLQQRIREEDWFLRDVMREGVVLYEARHERVGA